LVQNILMAKTGQIKKMEEKCKIEFPEEVSCTPPLDKCKKNPKPTPDWRKTEEPFVDEKDSSYCITIKLTEEVKSLSDVDSKIKIQALDKLLDFYGKSRDDLKDFISVDDIILEDLYVDPRIRILPKVLVKISTETFDKIPSEFESVPATTNLDDEETSSEAPEDPLAEISGESLNSENMQNASSSGNTFVIFRAKKMSNMFDNVAKKMAHLSRQQVSASYNDPAQVTNINLSKEASRLASFKGALLKLLGKNGLSLKEIQKIKISFAGEVEYVKVGQKRGCSEFLSQGLDQFKSDASVSNTNTLMLVQRLPEIYSDLNSKESMGWKQFNQKYLLQGPTGKDYLDMSSASEIYPFRKFIEDQFNSKPYKTAKDALMVTKALVDPPSMRQRYQMLIDEKIPVGDELINAFPELINNYGNDSDVYSLWGDVVNSVAKRGVSALTRIGLNKAMQELSINEVNEIISANFILNLDNEALVKFLDLLPAEQRDVTIRYDVGEILAFNKLTEDEKEEIRNLRAIEKEDRKEEKDAEKEKRREEARQSLAILESQIQNFVPPWEQGRRGGSYSSYQVSIENPSYGDDILSEYEEKLKFGTIASGNSSSDDQQTYDAYRQAIINNVDPQNIINLAALNFEGPDFYSTFCLKQPPTFSLDASIPGVTLPSLQFPDLPKFNKPIKLPKFPKFEVGDFLKPIIEEAEKAIVKIAINTILNIISKILSALGDGICHEPLNFGIGDTASANIRNLIINSLNLSHDSSEVNTDHYLTALLDEAGFVQNTSDESRQLVTDFVNDISVTLTESELLSLLRGEANPEVLKLISELAKMRNNSFSDNLTNPNVVADLFSSLSNFIPKRYLEDNDLIDVGNPSSVGICKTQGALDKFSKLRCSLLQQSKGIPEEECAKHLETLKKIAKNDVEDLNNILQNLDGILECSVPKILDDPSCPDQESNALLPHTPPELKAVTDSATKAYFDGLSIAFIDDLIDHQGFLDMVLSDELGAGYRQHDSLINGLFGKEKGEDLGIFQLFASKGPKGASIITGGSGSLANYPDEVASHLKGQIIHFQWSKGAASQSNIFLGGESDLKLNFGKIDSFSYSVKDILNNPDYDIALVENFGSSANPPIIIRGSTDFDSDLQNYLESDLQINLSDSSQGRLSTIQKIILNSWNSLEGYSSENDATLENFGEELFYYFYKKYLSLASTVILDTDVFSFGYDANAVAEKICLDHEKFGGTEENPPFYYEYPEREGWLGILDKMVPEFDGTEPRREGIVNFSEIANEVNDNTNLFKDDVRLNVNKKNIFIPPFYQIFDRSTKAFIEGAIKSTIRIYIIDTILKGLPVYSAFSVKFPQNYDDSLAIYIAQEMKRGLLDEGSNFFGLREDSYYLNFLEQMVQSFGEKVDAGLVEPTEKEWSAIDYLNQEQSKLNGDCKQDRKFKKKQKYEFLRREDIDEAAQVIAQRYIKEGLEEESKRFREQISPNSADVDPYFISNENWINFPVQSEDNLDVQDVVRDIWDETTHLDDIENGNNGFDKDYVPFVLEKYLMIEDYSEEEIRSLDLTIPVDISKREFSLFGVVNVEKWNEYLNSIKDIYSDKKISDFWKSWKFGVRISVLPPAGPDTDTDTWGEKFKEISSSLTTEACQNKKAFRVGESEFPLFPISSMEENIEDSQVSNFNDGKIITTFDDKLTCLLVDFFASPQYRAVFKFSLSFTKILSLLAIYTTRGFLPSLEPAEGALYFGPDRGIKSWDRETFKKSKDQARMMFEALYNSQNPNYKDRKQLGFADNYRIQKTIKFPQLDEALKWWERKLQRMRPVDKDGKPLDYGCKKPPSAGSDDATTSAITEGSSDLSNKKSTPTFQEEDLAILPPFPEDVLVNIENYMELSQQLDKVVDLYELSIRLELLNASGLDVYPESIDSEDFIMHYFGIPFGILETGLFPTKVIIPDFVTEGSSSTPVEALTFYLRQISSEFSAYISELGSAAAKSDKFDYSLIIEDFKENLARIERTEKTFEEMGSLISDLKYLVADVYYGTSGKKYDGIYSELINGSVDKNEVEVIGKKIAEDVLDLFKGTLSADFYSLNTFFEDLDETVN
jgi:hypothetical protein